MVQAGGHEKPALVFVYFLSFVDQLSRDLGALGLPLGERDAASLQYRFLFRARGYRQIVMNGLSYLKRSHTVTICSQSLFPSTPSEHDLMWFGGGAPD